MVSGSAAGNVSVAGVVTIPMMKSDIQPSTEGTGDDHLLGRVLSYDLLFAFVFAPSLTLHGGLVGNAMAAIIGFAGIGAVAVAVVVCLTHRLTWPGARWRTSGAICAKNTTAFSPRPSALTRKWTARAC